MAQIDPLEPEDIRALADAQLSREPDGHDERYSFSEFWYGDVAYFRAMAFGYPDTKMLLVARKPPSRPSPFPPS